MVSDGVDAYRAALTKASDARISNSKAVLSLVRSVLDPLSGALREWLRDKLQARRGRRWRAVPFLASLDPDLVAFIAVKALLATFGRNRRTLGVGPAVQTVFNRIGGAVESEAMVESFAKAHPDLVDAVLGRLDKTTSHIRHRRRVILSAAHKAGYVFPAWDEVTRVRVGAVLLELIEGYTGFVSTHRTGRGMVRAQLRPEATDALEHWHQYYELLQPRLVPCVVPPKPWVAGQSGGGYWTPVLGHKPLELTKATGKSRKGAVSETAIEAVNALQATPWSIDRRVLAVLKEVQGRGLDDLDVLPRLRDRVVPDKPLDIATNEEARKAWRVEAAGVYGFNSKLRSARLQLTKTMVAADEFADRERFYFPHYLDFRGRAYALPVGLTPQGPDYVKGLLRFADGKPLGEEGARWLAIHGANCFGVDKVSFDDRINWIGENERKIRMVAEDPLSFLWWTEADAPWQFLAWCHEWRDYLEAEATGQGAQFVSHLPIMVDGTCNGLQHYSALLRDEVGGAATNLVPSAKPQDIYGAVAERVMTRLRKDAESLFPSDAAARWSHTWLEFGVDRKITKRPVMVLPYGGQFTSCRKYVQEAVEERGYPEGLAAEHRRAAIHYLAEIVSVSIGDVVVAARAGMNWLRAASQVAADAGLTEVSWVTPVGFEVRQAYLHHNSRIIETAYHGKVMKLTLQEPHARKIDRRKQTNSLPPNFIHSMDAAAMQLTIVSTLSHGVSAFAMIHDSYGTHAADMPILAICLRCAFIAIYSPPSDPLVDFRDRLLARLPENHRAKLPPLPPKGSLDLGLVAQSEFFFA
jgi:DNA-directed RNA polymerase